MLDPQARVLLQLGGEVLNNASGAWAAAAHAQATAIYVGCMFVDWMDLLR